MYFADVDLIVDCRLNLQQPQFDSRDETGLSFTEWFHGGDVNVALVALLYLDPFAALDSF